ncbi:hypothetical protein Q3G72_000988 [Acer saccharum]|nr:hypothetical protein Q3G72_000988 [Acer saccharum]
MLAPGIGVFYFVFQFFNFGLVLMNLWVSFQSWVSRIGFDKKQPRRQALRFFSSAVDAAAALAHFEYIFACRVSSMEKPSSASDSGGAAPYNTVFVNTSLDTHLALIVSGSDTVADVKKKILHEHLLCFPNFGEINIQALKVKRRGNFYRLPDSMFVKSAFDGICKGWFLSVDASRLQKLVENQDSGDIVACFGITDNCGLLSDGPTRKLSYDGDSTLPQVQRDWHAKEKLSADTNCDNNYNILSLDANNRSDPELQEKHELLDSSKCKDHIMRTGCDEDNFWNVISDDQFSVSLDGGGTSSAAGKGKRKRKAKKKRGNESLEHALKENDASAQGTDKDVSLDGGGTSGATGKGKQKRKAKKERGNESLEHALKENDASAQGTDKDISQQDIVGPDNSLVSEDGFLTHDKCRVSMEEASPGPTKKKQKTLNNKNSSEMMLSAPVQEVRENETVPHSLDVDVSATDAGNDKSTNDPPEAAAASAVQGMRISDDRHTTEAEGNSPVAVQEGNDLKVSEVTVEPAKSSKKKKKSKKTQDPVTVTRVTSGMEVPPVAVQEGNDLSKDIGIEHGSVIVNDSQKFGSDQMARVEEERVLSQHNDSKTMPSTMCTPFSRDEIDMNSKVVVTSDLLDTNDIAKPGKSSKKKKKSKRTQDPVTSATEHMTCSVIGISLTEQHETVHKDHLSDKSRKEEGILFPSEENEESKAKTVNAPILATDRETDNVIQNVLESLQDQDLSKTAENKVEKSGKKTKRKRSSGAKSIPELQTEDENVSCKNVNLAIDGTRELEVDASSILTKKNLAKTSTEHQLNGSICKPGKIAGVETDPLHSQLNVKSSRVLSYKPDGNNGESPLPVKNSKLSEVSGTGTKAPPPSNKSDKFNSKTKEATGANTVNASRMIPRSNKKKETIAASNSSLESFKSAIPQSERVNRHQSQVAVRKKISNNDNGEVLNSSERKKSLLATSGTIFKFDSDRSSDDEDGVDNSDTSTRTPSDNSLSSDYSDGDSSAPRNGSHTANRKEQKGRNISNSQYSLNLDTIFRNSKRYKAAKLTASQSQPLDFDSQPDEFVPDSQP